jgi:hypothetical protein
VGTALSISSKKRQGRYPLATTAWIFSTVTVGPSVGCPSSWLPRVAQVTGTTHPFELALPVELHRQLAVDRRAFRRLPSVGIRTRVPRERESAVSPTPLPVLSAT